MSGNCDICFLRKFTLVNTETGAVSRPQCKSYTCRDHGWKRKKDLEKAINKFVDQWSHIRFWTFTLSSKINLSKQEHYKALSESWRYFITYLRRSKFLTKSERDLQYIKVMEPHKSGYYHIHLVADRYIQWEKIQALWIGACQAVLGTDEKVSHSYVKGKANAGDVGKYIAKYVVKCAHEREFRIRAWSKSGKVSVFEKGKNHPEWVLLPLDGNWSSYFISPPPLLEYSITKITTSKANAPPNTKSLFAELDDLSRSYSFMDANKKKIEKAFAKRNGVVAST